MNPETSNFLRLLKRKNAGDVGTHSTKANSHKGFRGARQCGQSGDKVGTKWGHTNEDEFTLSHTKAPSLCAVSRLFGPCACWAESRCPRHVPPAVAAFVPPCHASKAQTPGSPPACEGWHHSERWRAYMPPAAEKRERYSLVPPLRAATASTFQGAHS